VAGTGLLMVYRAVDPKYLNTYPAGQIGIAIYTKDAETLTGWAAKHSGPPTSNDMTRYWCAPANQAAATIGSDPGLAFDWVGDMGGATIHETATFLGTSYVFLLHWFATDPEYAKTMQQYSLQMLASFKELT
jgi:hypothetical protein